MLEGELPWGANRASAFSFRMTPLDIGLADLLADAVFAELTAWDRAPNPSGPIAVRR